MKTIKFRLPQSKKDIKQLWKEYTSQRYRHNADAMKAMTKFYINNVLNGRWSEVSRNKVAEWSKCDREQFEKEMWDKCYSYIHDLME